MVAVTELCVGTTCGNSKSVCESAFGHRAVIYELGCSLQFKINVQLNGVIHCKEYWVSSREHKDPSNKWESTVRFPSVYGPHSASSPLKAGPNLATIWQCGLAGRLTVLKKSSRCLFSKGVYRLVTTDAGRQFMRQLKKIYTQCLFGKTSPMPHRSIWISLLMYTRSVFGDLHEQPSRRDIYAPLDVYNLTAHPRLDTYCI